MLHNSLKVIKLAKVSAVPLLKMDKKIRVVITGIGPLASCGIGKNQFWQGLLEKKTGIKLEEYFIGDQLWDKFYLHKVENFDIARIGIEPYLLEQIKSWKKGEESTDLYFLLAAVKLAIDDAKLTFNRDNNDISCIITHENPGLEQYFSKIIDLSFDALINNKITKKDFAERLHYGSIKSSFDLQTFMTLFHVTKTFGIHGYSLFLNNACASGLYALENAAQIIKSGRSRTVIIAAADYPRIYKYLWFKELKMYSPDGKIRPFARDANGFVFGDGGVGLVLESLENAKKRKAIIYAEYLGGGFSQEGWKVTFPMSGGDFYQKAVAEALAFSRVKIKEIDCVCAHGAANAIIDRYEVKAITDIFGIKFKRPLITTFKPYVGHNLGGSALLETAILLLCMENNICLPVLNTETIEPKMQIDLVREKLEVKLSTVLKTCCAFAGYNAAAVFKRIR